MVYGHFFKGIIEAMLVDRLAGRTVPFSSSLWKILFYWIGLGVIVGFSLFHPALENEYLYESTPRSVLSKYIPASWIPGGRTEEPESAFTLLKF